MPVYTVKFTATIIVDGEMTIEAKDYEAAERRANEIAQDMNDDPPIHWTPFREPEHKAEWEESSFEIEYVEVS